MTTETSNARGEWVLVPRWNMERVAESLERDGDEHGAAYELRDMLAAAPPPADAPPAPVSVPLDRLTALDGLVDRIAEAIRDGAGLAEGDPPWERLGEERRAPWRADAMRALAVVKESLTAETRTPPPAAARGDARIIARDIHYAIMDAGLAPLSNADNHKVREAILRVLQAALAAEGVQAEPNAEARGVVDEGSRSVTRQLLHWGGVPVHVTGTVTTSPGNWSLIDAALAAQHQEPTT